MTTHAEIPLGVFVALIISCTWAVGAPVAMVTDLIGTATIEGGGPVALLDEVNIDTTIIVAEESNLVVVYFDSGIEYTITGPGSAILKVPKPVTSGGATATARSLGPVGDSVRINPAGKAQASLVLRDSESEVTLELISPIAPRISGLRPVFTWRPVPGAIKYRFELADDQLDTVVEATIETCDTCKTCSFSIPEGIELEADGAYMWEVATQQTPGERISSYAYFTVSSQSQQDIINTLQPGPEASVAQQVIFAVWLDQNGFTEDAEKIWTALKKIRPDLEVPE